MGSWGTVKNKYVGQWQNVVVLIIEPNFRLCAGFTNWTVMFTEK